MIFDALTSLLLSILEPVVELLPTFTVAQIPGVADALRTGIYAADPFVPLVGPVSFLLTVLGWAAPFVVVAVIVWVWNLLPFT